MRALLIFGLLLTLAVVPAVAAAQQVKIEAPAPPVEREPAVIAPELQYEVTAPNDGDYFPPGPRVRHDPAFIAPLSARTETGRAGVAGWTSPNPHLAGPLAGWKEITGWFAVGFAVTWGAPPPSPARTPTR